MKQKSPTKLFEKRVQRGGTRASRQSKTSWPHTQPGPKHHADLNCEANSPGATSDGEPQAPDAKISADLGRPGGNMAGFNHPHGANTATVEPKVKGGPAAVRADESVLKLSVFPKELDETQQELAVRASEISKLLGREVLLLVQSGEFPQGMMSEQVYHEIRCDFRRFVKKGQKCTVILHSPGGYAGSAYRLARFLQRHCGGYDVVIPSRAKSAATLFSLGADTIFMGDDAELGPLDAQIADLDKEVNISALEVVQSVQALSTEALNAVDAAVLMWVNRSGKKIESLLPAATKFVAELMHPLFNKIDAVHFTGMARSLSVANDYAVRLLRTYGENAQVISLILTGTYSEHDFAIDADEAKNMGLRVEPVPATIQDQVDELSMFLDKFHATSAIGRVTSEDLEDAGGAEHRGHGEDSVT